MIRDNGRHLEVAGPMTLECASALYEAGNRALRGGVTVFDLATVKEVDSSGLAVIFGWQRAAQGSGRSIRIVNVPGNLISLATLYGVSELLPL